MLTSSPRLHLSHTTPTVVGFVLLSGQFCRMLIGACNPMLCDVVRCCARCIASGRARGRADVIAQRPGPIARHAHAPRGLCSPNQQQSPRARAGCTLTLTLTSCLTSFTHFSMLKAPHTCDMIYLVSIAYRMLNSACNPTMCPSHVLRPLRPSTAAGPGSTSPGGSRIPSRPRAISRQKYTRMAYLRAIPVHFVPRSLSATNTCLPLATILLSFFLSVSVCLTRSWHHCSTVSHPRSPPPTFSHLVLSFSVCPTNYVCPSWRRCSSIRLRRSRTTPSI